MSEPQMPASGLRQLWARPALLADPIVLCVAMVILTSLFFLLFPHVDLWFSGLFYNDGFLVRELAFFQGVRSLHSALTWIIAIGVAIPLVLKVIMPAWPSILRPRDSLFVLSTLAIAPGIVVNGIFKSHWGRPRPVNVVDFGGEQPFIGVWQITNYCDMNCSFVSGESSSAAWLLTAVVLFPGPVRPLAARIILALAILFALNRIAFGGHFLSDVLIAWWMTLAIMAAIYRILYIHPPEALTNRRLETGLADFGNAIRATVGRWTGRSSGQ